MAIEDALAPWLGNQRWFAGKGQGLRDLAIVAETELVAGDPELRHLIVAASHGTAVDYYQILVGLRRKLPEALPWTYWVAYFSGAFLAWIVAQAISALVFGRPMRDATVHGFASGQSNIVLVGIPLVLSAYGEQGAVPLFLLIAVNLPVMMTTASLLIEASSDGISRGQITVIKTFLPYQIIAIGSGSQKKAAILCIPELLNGLVIQVDRDSKVRYLESGFVEFKQSPRQVSVVVQICSK